MIVTGEIFTGIRWKAPHDISLARIFYRHIYIHIYPSLIPKAFKISLTFHTTTNMAHLNPVLPTPTRSVDDEDDSPIAKIWL